MKDNLNSLPYGHVYNLSQGLCVLQKKLEEGYDENYTNNEDPGEVNEQQWMNVDELCECDKWKRTEFWL